MQIGDVVVVKPDLNVKDDYAGSPGYIPELEMYRGQRVTVRECNDESVQNFENGDWFAVEENPWIWCLRWVIEVNEKEIKEISDEEFTALLNGD